MNSAPSVASRHADDEIGELIATLHRTSRRLEQLTAGQVDTVADAEGRPFLLRHAQEQLGQAHATRQAAILNALPAHMALLDSAGTIVSVNEAWRQFGYANALNTPGFAVGVNYLDVCDRAMADGLGKAGDVARGLRAVLAGQEKRFSIQYPCHSPTEERWFLLTAAPLSENLRNGAIVMHVNVTAEQKSTQLLLASELRFRQMAENIRDVFFLRDTGDNRILYVSPAYEEIWGRSCASLYAHPESWLESIHPDDRAGTFDQQGKGVLAGDYRLEYRILRPDGSIRWIESRGFPVHDEGRVSRIAGIATDITERKTAEARITYLSRVHAMLSGINTLIVRVRDRDELFKGACNIAVEAGGFRMCLIAVVDSNTRTVVPVASAGKDEDLLAAIKGLLSVADTVSTTMVGRALREKKALISNDSQRDPRMVLKTKYAESGVRSLAVLPLIVSEEAVGVLVLYASEIDFFHEDELALLIELAGDIAFSLSMLQVRAERETAVENLRSSLKEKEALLKEVHHRVKNNMQVITSLLRLEANRIDHPATRSVLKDMQNRIMAMAALHEAVYRSESFARVDLAVYLKQVANQLRRSLVATHGQVSFRLDLLPVGIDLDQAIPCGLIVNELVSNALKHAFPDGRAGEVRIELKQAGPGELQLTVSDDGIGLPANFETARTKSLGLQLVSDLARQLGGRLRVDPRPKALFEVTFPFEVTPGIPRGDVSDPPTAGVLRAV